MHGVDYIQESQRGVGCGGLGDAANLLYGLISRYFRHLRVYPDI